MKIKNKESFVQGIQYASGLVGNEGLAWWKDVFGDVESFADENSKQEFLMCLEQMVLGFADLINEERDLDVLGIKFKG